MTWEELPTEAQDAIREAFPGLAGPRGAAVRWKAAGDPTESLTAFEGGRLIATVSVNRQLGC